MKSMTRKRPAWSWADYHREERKRRKPPSDDFLQLLLPHLRDMEFRQLVELAERAGIHHGTLYFWISGRTKTATGRTLTAVARELGYEMVEKPRPHLRVVK